MWHVWLWHSPLVYRNHRTAHQKPVRSAKPQNQTSSGPTGDSVLCLYMYAASYSFKSTGLFEAVVFFPIVSESGMTLLLEYPNLNYDFSNLLLNCSSALGSMHMLSKAVNEIKPYQKLSAVSQLFHLSLKQPWASVTWSLIFLFSGLHKAIFP